MRVDGVVGVGIGSKAGTRVIQVYVKVVTKAVCEKVPAILDGHPTDVVKVGEVRKL